MKLVGRNQRPVISEAVVVLGPGRPIELVTRGRLITRYKSLRNIIFREISGFSVGNSSINAGCLVKSISKQMCLSIINAA